MPKYKIRDGETFEADNASDVVAYMAHTSRVEFPTYKSWMLACADRIGVQVGPQAQVSIDTPERFVADLVALGLLIELRQPRR